MKFRCLSCPGTNGTEYLEFEIQPSDAHKECPSCGTSIKSGRILLLATIHFDPPFNDDQRHYGRRGCGKRACDGKPAKSSNELVSGHPGAVTCEACIRTPSWRKWLDAAKKTPSDRQIAILAEMEAAKDAVNITNTEVVPCPTSADTLPGLTTPPTAPSLSDPPKTDGESNKA